MDDDLIERLRTHFHGAFDQEEAPCSVCREAAARLAELRAERDTLKWKYDALVEGPFNDGHEAAKIEYRDAIIAAEDRAESAEAEVAKLREENERLQSALLKWAISRHTNKCYLCNASWSDGAPDIHVPECLLARTGHTTALGGPNGHD